PPCHSRKNEPPPAAAMRTLCRIGVASIEARRKTFPNILPGRNTMARISRRTILKGTGGMAAILATGRAPAFAQESTIHWLRWNDFIPSSDEVLRKQIVPECKKAL